VLDIGASQPLPPAELEYRASRSGGPGGQHVNTSSTRVELTFDVAGSPTLTDAERALVRRRLGSRLDSDGRLRVVAQDERSQHRNRRIATERFCALMREALAPPPPPRRPTRPTRAATEERLASKRRDAVRKRQRRPPADADDRAEAGRRAA
jgi:ribosome-associated protein